MTALLVDHPDYIERYGAAWSSRDHKVLTEFFAEDGVYVEGAMDATYAGVPGVAKFFRYMLAFSSDSTVEFTSFIREGEYFAAEWLWWGTADGPLVVGSRRIEPTDLPYVVPGVAICRVDSRGLVDHHKDYYDLQTLVAQVTGERVAPPPPPRAPATGDARRTQEER